MDFSIVVSVKNYPYNHDGWSPKNYRKIQLFYELMVFRTLNFNSSKLCRVVRQIENVSESSKGFCKELHIERISCSQVPP